MFGSLSKRILIVTMLISVVVFSSTAQTDEIIVPEGENVVLGFAAGLSGEGIAPLGIDIQRGVELAQEDRPSVTVDGVEFMVTVDVQDSMCNAEGGQSVANRFTADENVVGVVGHMCSSACTAAAPIYDSAGFTTISPSCTGPLLSQSGFTSFNRAVASDAFQGSVTADYIFNELGLTRVATIHDGSPYGEGLVNVLTARFTELGGEIVAADAVNVGDTDFRALLEDFSFEDPELIYFGGFPAEGARLMQQLADAGLEDVVFMGADGIQGTEVVNLAGEAAEGSYATAPVPASSEELDAFLERYVATYGEEPPAPFHANGYDSYNIFLDAIEATATVNDDGALVISRQAISDYVRSLSGFEGLIGRLEADGTGETATIDVGIFQVIDGAYEQVFVIDATGDDMMEEDMGDEEAMGNTIVDIVTASAESDEPEFTSLLAAVQGAGDSVVGLLSGEGPLTVFAPTDAAFAALGEETLNAVLGSPVSLQAILSYHVVEGAFTAEDVIALDGQTVDTLIGQPISIAVVDGGVVINGTVNVTMTDIMASNGVIHVIDAVLIPEGAPQG